MTLLTILLDPRILALILTAFGTAIGWLVRNGISCRQDKAVLETKLENMEVEVERLQGSVDTLCALIRRETYLA